MVRKKLFLLMLSIASVIAPFSAFSGTIEQANITAEPAMMVKDGSVTGCGYRLISLAKEAAPQSSTLVMDTSFNVFKPGLSMVKGGATLIEPKPGGGYKNTTKPIESFWMKVQSKKPTSPVGGKVIPAETAGYLMYAIPLNSLAELYGALLEGTPVTIGMRMRGNAVDKIYTGTVMMPAEAGDEGRRCFSELAKEIEESQQKKR